MPLSLRVTRQELSDEPVNPLIYGSFIESGLARQVDQMWSQLLWNPSFEEIPPLTGPVWGWLGRSPQDDLTVEDWWHSGYEEHEWHVVSPDERASVEYCRDGGFYHGVRASVLHNNSEEHWASLAQDGLLLRSGQSYVLHGWARHGEAQTYGGPEVAVRIGLYRDGDLNAPIFVEERALEGGPWQEIEATLRTANYDGRHTFALSVPPGASVQFDGLSLMPADNVEGWRADVVEALKRGNTPILRWPGGCYASFYNWRDGIGPRLDRRPRESHYWGGLEMNDVGTVEFVRLCRLVGSEPFLCANVMTGSAEEAADWVAYCNAPTDTPLGALRAKHGHPEPLNVRYWELDNETYRRFDSLEYAERCVEFSRAMKAVDPDIKLVMVGYWRYRSHLPEMLETAGEHVDLITDRGMEEGYLRGVLDDIVAYNARTGRDIRLCNTEWIAPVDGVPVVPDAINRQQDDGKSTLQEKEIRWAYAMNAGRQLLLFQRLGGRFEFACFNNMANTWGQNLIECPKEPTFLSATGRVFELLSRSPAAWTLRIEGEASTEDFEMQVSWDAERHRLVVTALNYTATPREVDLDLTDLGFAPHRAEFSALTAASLSAHNTVADHDAIARKDWSEDLDGNQTLRITVPAFGVLHGVVGR